METIWKFITPFSSKAWLSLIEEEKFHLKKWVIITFLNIIFMHLKYIKLYAPKKKKYIKIYLSWIAPICTCVGEGKIKGEKSKGEKKIWGKQLMKGKNQIPFDLIVVQ